MAQRNDHECDHAKARAREEIAEQVQEFLRKGGKIDVLKDNETSKQSPMGSVWQNQDDLGTLIN